MLKCLFKLYLIFTQDFYLSVNLDAAESLFFYLLQYLFMSTFAASDHRRQDQQLSPFLKVHYCIYNLVYRLAGYRLSAYRAVRFSYPGI